MLGLTAMVNSGRLELQEGRQFLVVLPAGSLAFSLRLTRQGLPLWERTFRQGDCGVFLDPETIEAEGGPRAQIAATAPFPGPLELPGASGERLTYWALLESGMSSEPAEVVLPLR